MHKVLDAQCCSNLDDSVSAPDFLACNASKGNETLCSNLMPVIPSRRSVCPQQAHALKWHRTRRDASPVLHVPSQLAAYNCARAEIVTGMSFSETLHSVQRMSLTWRWSQMASCNFFCGPSPRCSLMQDNLDTDLQFDTRVPHGKRDEVIGTCPIRTAKNAQVQRSLTPQSSGEYGGTRQPSR
jgi:hypothetical protein